MASLFGNQDNAATHPQFVNTMWNSWNMLNRPWKGRCFRRLNTFFPFMIDNDVIIIKSDGHRRDVRLGTHVVPINYESWHGFIQLLIVSTCALIGSIQGSIGIRAEFAKSFAFFVSVSTNPCCWWDVHWRPLSHRPRPLRRPRRHLGIGTENCIRARNRLFSSSLNNCLHYVKVIFLVLRQR